MTYAANNSRPVETETERILAAYDRRSKSIITERYTPLDSFYLLNLQNIEREMIGAIKRNGLLPLATRTILEPGCGNGKWLRELVKWGASPERITGIDVQAAK